MVVVHGFQDKVKANNIRRLWPWHAYIGIKRKPSHRAQKSGVNCA